VAKEYHKTKFTQASPNKMSVVPPLYVVKWKVVVAAKKAGLA
jgi:hypothetical protein